MNTTKRFWALCLDTHMKLALYKYAIIIIYICMYVCVCTKRKQHVNGVTIVIYVNP